MLEYIEAPVLPDVPHSREAEEATVGAVLINPEVYPEISQFLKADDFYIFRHKWIWDAFSSLHTRRIPIDLLTITDELARTEKLGEIGGPAYLTGLINQVPSSLNAASYARIVQGFSWRRMGIQKANLVAQAAYDTTKDFDLGKYAIEFARSARSETNRVTPFEAADRVAEMVLDNNHFTTGVVDVDRKIGGLFPDELGIWAGYQGTGKSAAMIHSARVNAEQNNRVLMCSLEMTAGQVWARMACGDLKLDFNQVRSGRVSDATRGDVIQKAHELAEKYEERIVIYESPMTPSDILSAVMIENPQVVFVDTLRNIKGKDKRDQLRDWYDGVCLFMRDEIAKAAHVSVTVLHHLNRSVHRESRRPTMHDLMFAGESDSDSIILLYRKPEDYEVAGERGVKTIVPIEWIVDKSRFGWTGAEEVNYDLVSQRFYGMSKGEL